ncbi:MAG: ATP-binding protein [Halobacteriales archaeon]
MTERRQQSRALERAEERYRILAENFPNGGVHYFDDELRYQIVAGSGFNAIETSPEDLVGNTIYEVEPYSDEIIETLEPMMKATLDGQKETTEIHYEGHVYRLSSVPIRDDDGTVTSGFFIAQDITEQHQRQQKLEAKNEQLEQFASIVSHDLRNPLRVAEGHLELAQEECDSTHLKDAVDAIDRSQALIADLLTLAREGKELGEVVSVSLPELTRQCWQTVKTADSELQVTTEQTIQADRSLLQQVLENLISNAVEHGGGDVTITIGELQDGFYVADNGPGVPAEEREVIFEASYSTEEENTGFGLAIVKRIVEAHGWEIQVTDSEAGGARFEITGVESA